jgi:iron complex outermembrane receptor protein
MKMTKKLKKEIYILSVLVFYGQLLAAQLRTFSGQVIDSLSQEPVAFSMIRVSESNRLFNADARGKFELMLENKESVKVLIYSSGYTEKEMMLDAGTPVIIKLSPAHRYLNEVVVTASRFQELFMKSSASIEKINEKGLNQLPAISFYETLNNLSGVQLVTTSLLFKQINTRGFNNTPNQRLLQLIDGIDNQPPGLNFPIGNIFGPPDIDIENIEIVPGTASVLYGPAAFNGIVAIKTKSPFDYTGVNIRSLTGINHLNDPNSAIKSFSDISIRYGQVIKKKFAFKIAGRLVCHELCGPRSVCSSCSAGRQQSLPQCIEHLW